MYIYLFISLSIFITILGNNLIIIDPKKIMAGESVEVAMEAREQQSETNLEPASENVVDEESQQHPPDPHHHHHRRHRRHHRHHHRHHRRSRSSRSARYEKSILHFGTAHIVVI